MANWSESVFPFLSLIPAQLKTVCCTGETSAALIPLINISYNKAPEWVKERPVDRKAARLSAGKLAICSQEHSKHHASQTTS